MDSIEFPEANKKFVGPGCDQLIAFSDGEEVISKWELSEADKELVAKTGVVWLRVRGRTTPPVLVTAEYPFEEEQ